MSSRLSLRDLAHIERVAHESLGFEAREFDKLGDAVEISAEEFAELLGARAPQPREALAGKLLLHVGHGKHFLDRPVQNLDDGARRAFRREYAVPARVLIAGH